MSEQSRTLSGYWTGEYDYPVLYGPVAFNAHVIEENGALSGSITEPDTHGFFEPVIVMSSLDGSREGSTVRFIKRMQNAGLHDPIHYVGVVNAKGTEIRGRWIIPGEWSGNFHMTRGDIGEEEAITRHEAVDA